MSISAQQRDLLTRTWVDFMPMQRFAERPLIVERAERIFYWDINGKRYLDAIGGVFVANLGHRHPRIVEAVCKQMDRITLAPPLHGVADVTLELIEKLGAVTPGDLNYIKTFSGGSEAIEAAIKLSRQYWKQSGHPEERNGQRKNEKETTLRTHRKRKPTPGIQSGSTGSRRVTNSSARVG